VKRSLSVKKITEFFDELDGRLTVIFFHPITGQRIVSYSSMNPVDVLKEVARKINRGQIAKIFINLPSEKVTPRTISDIDVDFLWHT
jgi:hypothetical protein